MPFFNKCKENPTVEEAREYLKKHFRYYTANSWNLNKSYAFNVKLHNIGLQEEAVDMDLAYTLVFSPQNEFSFDVSTLIRDFELAHPGYTAGFNGRMGGYLVLYNTEYSMRGIDMDADYDEWEDWEVLQRYALLRDFADLADNIRDCLLNHLESSKSRSIIYLKYEKIEVALRPDNVDDEEENLGDILKKDVPSYDIVAYLHPVTCVYRAHVPQLEQQCEDFAEIAGDGFTGESLEHAVMRAEKAILDYVEKHPDAPKPEHKKRHG